MSHNRFGKLFCITTFGESHGPAIGCVVDGCPPGLAISPDEIRAELLRRATGRSRHTSQRKEKDEVRILSGVFEGRTTGTPIGLLVENTDARSRDYDDIKRQFRPGHADYTYFKKYGIRDYRGGGRSSARETTMRVAAGAIARKWLKLELGIEIQGWLAQLGPIRCDEVREWDTVDDNPFFCADPDRLDELDAFMTRLRKDGDSIGARIDDPVSMRQADRFTVLASLLGLPAVAVPSGEDAEGAPLSVQCVSAAGREDVALGLAAGGEPARDAIDGGLDLVRTDRALLERP